MNTWGAPASHSTGGGQRVNTGGAPGNPNTGGGPADEPCRAHLTELVHRALGVRVPRGAERTVALRSTTPSIALAYGLVPCFGKAIAGEQGAVHGGVGSPRRHARGLAAADQFWGGAGTQPPGARRASLYRDMGS